MLAYPPKTHTLFSPFYFEIIVDSQEVTKIVQRKEIPMYPSPISPQCYILHNFRAILKPEN